MKRHQRDNYFVVGEGIYTYDGKGPGVCERPSTAAELRKFRFSRLGPKGVGLQEVLRRTLAEAMTADIAQTDADIPAGFTYLGQLIDHDLTLDKTAKALGSDVTVDELVQGRSPALDLDCLYGRGPVGEDLKFYADGIRLKVGRTAATTFPDQQTDVDLDGFDLPRVGFGSLKSERRKALIPDERNDENLAVAQTHLAFIRFHNRMVDQLAAQGTRSAKLFRRARDLVVRHYQWMIRTDFLPRIVDPAVVEDVFTNGRRFFEVTPPYGEGYQARRSFRYRQPGDAPTMPIEFSVAAYRLGHSMVRGAYQWNRVFRQGGPGPIATLGLLFTFSGTSGVLSPTPCDIIDPESGDFDQLPTNWIADFRRLYDFTEAGRSDLVAPDGELNVTKRIDSLLVNPLRDLPLGAFGGRGTNPLAQELNLAFRNLTRAEMVELASGQQMAEFLEVPPLSADAILNGAGGAVLDTLSQAEEEALTANTPLWFYILREAETHGGRLTGVGARIVAEVFHRAIEGSQTSIVRDPHWRPSLGPDDQTFRMTDLLLVAFDGRADLLNPLGD